jgi:hypothetical protein
MKIRVETAMMAVTTSIDRTACMGKELISSAPNGGDTIFRTPSNVWFRPAIRARCAFGTISEIEEASAGEWNALPAARTSRMI